MNSPFPGYSIGGPECENYQQAATYLKRIYDTKKQQKCDQAKITCSVQGRTFTYCINYDYMGSVSKANSAFEQKKSLMEECSQTKSVHSKLILSSDINDDDSRTLQKAMRENGLTIDVIEHPKTIQSVLTKESAITLTTTFIPTKL